MYEDSHETVQEGCRVGDDYVAKVRNKLTKREEGEGEPIPIADTDAFKRLKSTMSELAKLKVFAKKKKELFVQGKLPEEEKFVIKSIKTDGRKPAVKEFEFEKEIGVGNFSRIVRAKHKTTGEVFAVKIIEKKQVREEEANERIEERRIF